MLTTFLALVITFDIPYPLVPALTLPLLMLFNNAMFMLSLFVSFTQNMPHACPSFADTVPLFSLLTTVNKRASDCDDDDDVDDVDDVDGVVDGDDVDVDDGDVDEVLSTKDDCEG